MFENFFAKDSDDGDDNKTENMPTCSFLDDVVTGDLSFSDEVRNGTKQFASFLEAISEYYGGDRDAILSGLLDCKISDFDLRAMLIDNLILSKNQLTLDDHNSLLQSHFRALLLYQWGMKISGFEETYSKNFFILEKRAFGRRPEDLFFANDANKDDKRSFPEINHYLKKESHIDLNNLDMVSCVYLGPSVVKDGCYLLEFNGNLEFLDFWDGNEDGSKEFKKPVYNFHMPFDSLNEANIYVTKYLTSKNVFKILHRVNTGEMYEL